MEPPFRVGDKVRLVAGSPRFAVTECLRSDGRWMVDCIWYDSEGRSASRIYPAEALMPDHPDAIPAAH